GPLSSLPQDCGNITTERKQRIGDRQAEQPAVSFRLEHDSEKWAPVFGKDHAPPKGYCVLFWTIAQATTPMTTTMATATPPIWTGLALPPSLSFNIGSASSSACIRRSGSAEPGFGCRTSFAIVRSLGLRPRAPRHGAG